ncbi:VWA domain-containing protein [Sutcliffiella halmapala]|uniref:VWA domain-containing protein n=1 Tax=Sutcliffiella halmapala TaxID=79882 RepID=UPI000994ED6D|nr:VWA domain-containing protein [Sutcliffiella halmapala]
MQVQIEHPLMLLFLLPIFVSLFLFWRKKKQKGKKEYVIFTLRSLLYFLLILGLCVPAVLYPVEGVHTVFIIDQSESVKRKENEMLDSVNKAIQAKGEKDSFSIMTVANRAKLEWSFQSEKETISNLSTNEETYFTNLEEGLKLATTYIPTEAKGRVVLLSDGIETTGNVLRQGKLLASRNIELDVLPFQPQNVQDVSFESFFTPQSGFEGEALPFHITLDSNVETNALLQITQNSKTVIQEPIRIEKGKNYYSYHTELSTPGLYTFKAEVIPDSDQIKENNISHSITRVNGQPKVLLVDKDNEGGNVYQALTASGWKIDRLQPDLLPTTLAGFLAYESIIFNNISGHQLNENQMTLLETAVKDFGIGFIMTGGEESYGLGGYFQTPIEKILPVDMDVKGKKEIPSLGIVIVLDRSGSMSGQKFELAKEAAARSVEMLREEDTFGFIAFDTEPWTVVETEKIKNKAEVIETIRSTALGGGTEIYPALSLAYEELNKMDLKRKHIILLTDGQSPNGDYEELIEEGLSNNVTLSTVAIGGDADRSLLEELSEYGTGRFYDVYDASSIPSILSRETALTTKTYIEDNPHTPNVTAGYDWSKRFATGIPPINSYIATTLKSRAEQIISSEKDDPILARMNYGLGRTVAWTSDVTGEWSGGFPAWVEWTGFWNEIVNWSLPSYEKGNYDISSIVSDGKAQVTIEAVQDILLPLSITVSNNEGKLIEEAKSKLVGPGQYEVEFPAMPEIYFINITQEEDEETVNSYTSGLVIPFSTEYEQRPLNLSLLETLATNNKGKILEKPEEAFRDWHKNIYNSQSIWSPFIFLAFFLLILEIFIRRFGLAPFSWWKRFIFPSSSQKKEKNTKKVRKKERHTKNELKREDPKPTKQKKSDLVEESLSTEEKEDRISQLLKAKNRKRR